MQNIPDTWERLLDKKIITEAMLSEALFSVNKRAKNVWEPECRQTYSEDEPAVEERSYYDKKDRLLAAISPVCIHREHCGYETRRYYDDDEGFADNLVRCLCGGLIIGAGEYCPDGQNTASSEKTGSFFDALQVDEENVAYYLYYKADGRGFHHPISEPEVSAYKEKYRIPIVDIGRINSRGYQENDLAPLEFVDAVLRVIESGNYTYERDPYGDDEEWFDTDYRPGLSDEDAWENIENALDNGWGVVLSDLVSPIISRALPSGTLSISRDERARAEEEKIEDKRMRSSAKGKCREIRLALESCQKREKVAQTAEELLSVRKSLAILEKKFDFVVKKPREPFENDLVGYVLWWSGTDPECCTYGFSSVQELAEYMIEAIGECGLLLPDELHQIAMEYYETHWQGIWRQESSSLRKTHETLKQTVENRIHEMSAYTEKEN